MSHLHLIEFAPLAGCDHLPVPFTQFASISMARANIESWDYSAYRDQIPSLARSVNEWVWLFSMAYNAKSPRDPSRHMGGATSEAVEFYGRKRF